MTPICENFISAVLNQRWRTAFTNLNALEMDEMLKALATIDRLDLNDLWAQNKNFTHAANMPRIDFARSVVNLRLPVNVPADLQKSGQVAIAQTFINTRPFLTFQKDLTGKIPAARKSPARLSEADYAVAARTLRAEVAAVAAVAQVESSGQGFAADGRPIIRYELHKFSQFTGGIYDDTHPHLSQPTLALGKPYHNGTQAREWNLIFNAMILRNGRARRFEDAWKSASWGKFQVMGFNYKVAGWNDAGGFVKAMFESEAGHLKAFLGFCTANNLVRYIQTRDWASFANGYNGSGYAANHYDANMANAYAAISANRQKQKPDKV